MINIRKRNGISSIIGSMTLLLIITSFSSILLVTALNNINMFNISLNEERKKITSGLDPIIVEHVKLNTVDNSITIWIRNLSDEIRKIDSISIFNFSEQKIVYHREGINTNIIPRQLTMLTYNNLNTLNNTSIYKIVIRLDDGTSITAVINR